MMFLNVHRQRRNLVVAGLIDVAKQSIILCEGSVVEGDTADGRSAESVKVLRICFYNTTAEENFVVEINEDAAKSGVLPRKIACTE